MYRYDMFRYINMITIIGSLPAACLPYGAAGISAIAPAVRSWHTTISLMQKVFHHAPLVSIKTQPEVRLDCVICHTRHRFGIMLHTAADSTILCKTPQDIPKFGRLQRSGIPGAPHTPRALCLISKTLRSSATFSCCIAEVVITTTAS